ncbi:hypothetical protein BFJ67_g6107 [Fusarium oxysporum f. sp. cepae]|nr:hypothetical protein BFJ67_g6107 [Fusarium oxysporum f. sp. cepae]
MVTFLGEWLGVCPSLPSLATSGGSPVVHIDAPVDAELDQHHGRSRAAFDVAVELPLSRLSLVSFVSPFNLRYAESNGKTRILGYRFSFCLLFCLKQLILPILLDDDSLESNSS